MLNNFTIVGKVSVISEKNSDYPGFYIEPHTETGELIPISINKDTYLISVLEQLKNGMLVCVNGKIKMCTEDVKVVIKLVADKVAIINK